MGGPPPPGWGPPPPGWGPPPPGWGLPPGYPPPPGMHHPADGQPPVLAEGERPEDFLARLPPFVSPAEEALRGAVFAFLETWTADHEDGSMPKLVHLGADQRVR